MPINKKLYQSVVPMRNDATTMYMRERIDPINADGLYVTIGGKKVLKSSLNQREQFISKPTNTTESKQSKDLAEDKIATKERLDKFAEEKRIDKERELKVAPYAAMGLVGTLTGTLPLMIGGEIGGRSVDYGSKKLTGKSFGENVLPEAPAIGSLLNPGYIVGGLVGQYRNTLGKNIYKINPLSEKLNNRNSSYRVVGSDAYEDFVKSGVVRTGEGAHTGQMFRGKEIIRPTSFPSFQKGYADLSYAPKNMYPYVFETKVPTFKRGDINPVTGVRISGRHYAHRPIDMTTGKVITELPSSDVKVFDGKPHWLKGYKEITNNKK